MKTILITGGNGYIATSLYESLKNIYEITCVNRSHFDLTDSEQTNEWFKDKYFDVVIHTAISGGSRLKTDTVFVLDANLKMYYNLLGHKNNYGKFINIGSGAELYQQNTPYGLSKHVIRSSLLERSEMYNLRIYAIFNENELNSRFIKANLLRYLKKESMNIQQDKLMDFFYMKDFVNLIQYYIDNDSPPKEFDCCYNESLYLSQIVSKINNLSDHVVEVNITNNIVGDNYVGTYTPIDLNFIGLDMGIKLVYEKLYANNIR